MNTALLPLSAVLAIVLLSGCPDSKVPKVPPSTPEPKASPVKPVSGADAAPLVAGLTFRPSGSTA
jgi:hypothetical protein